MQFYYIIEVHHDVFDIQYDVYKNKNKISFTGALPRIPLDYDQRGKCLSGILITLRYLKCFEINLNHLISLHDYYY